MLGGIGHALVSAFEEAVNAMRNRDIMILREIDAALADAKKGLEGDAKNGLENVTKVLQRNRDTLADAIGTQSGVVVE
jgi:hypothetical protein